MTVALSYAKYQQLLKANQQPCQNFETVSNLPQEIGDGNCRNIEFERGLSLTIREFQMRDRIFDSVSGAQSRKSHIP